MQTTQFQNIVRLLTQDQTPRVWSLLISVFGDIAQEKGAQISGPFLRQLTGMIGIKPEAMRVALHRLRKEGWIESHRRGRTSAYCLTAWGRAQTVTASPRIYATGPAAKAAWLAVFNPAQPAPSDEANGAWVSSNMLITSRKPDHGHAFSSHLTPDTEMPDWMTGKVCDTKTLRLSQDFAQALDAVKDQLTGPLNPLETAVLRVLLVHGWRRIVLKTPVLPDHVFPEGWSGGPCRASVAALLMQYPKPPIGVLEAAITSEQDTD